MKVTADDILVMIRLVDDLCGIVLDESKGYLIEDRLIPVAEQAGCESISELYHRVRHGQDEALARLIIDAITTNETLFFRDNSPFEALRYKAAPEMIDTKVNTPQPKRLRIWSAAASTGQEPYSIAMTLCELIPDIHSWDISILGTDICDSAIAQASRGSYSEFEIGRGMDQSLLNKYFVRDGSEWRVKDELRSLVKFERRNLLQPFSDLPTFDIIFCRNVAIYFSEDDQRSLFNRLADKLVREGYLFVGSSESLSRFGSRFRPQHHCRAVFYQPNLEPLAMAG